MKEASNSVINNNAAILTIKKDEIVVPTKSSKTVHSNQTIETEPEQKSMSSKITRS